MDRRTVVVTGFGTFAVTCAGGGAKLAFPDMIIPFAWAIVLMCLGVIVGICTLVYAFWPTGAAPAHGEVHNHYYAFAEYPNDNPLDRPFHAGRLMRSGKGGGLVEIIRTRISNNSTGVIAESGANVVTSEAAFTGNNVAIHADLGARISIKGGVISGGDFGIRVERLNNEK